MSTHTNTSSTQFYFHSCSLAEVRLFSVFVNQTCDCHNRRRKKEERDFSKRCFFFFSPRRFERAIRKRPNTVRCLAVKSTLLGTRHPRKEKEAALQNVIGEPACLCGEITMCHSIGDGTKHKKLKWKSVAHIPAGSPIHRASQGLLPGAPT